MQISIKYIDFPKPGKKYGKLTLTDGAVIMCPPDLLGGFRAGSAYDVQVKEQTWYQGQPTEQRVTIIAGGPTGPVQGQGGQAGYQRPSQGQGFQRSNTGFQPRVIQGGPPDQAKDRHIFVCGVVQQAMSSGKFTASEIPVLTAAANEAFDMIRPRPKPAPPPPDRGYFPTTGELPPLDEGDPGPELQ